VLEKVSISLAVSSIMSFRN